MKIKEGFVLRNVSGQAVVIATGNARLSFHGMVKLNETAEKIWKSIEEGLDFNSIVDMITEKYNVDKDAAAADVSEFIEEMKNAGFLEP